MTSKLDFQSKALPHKNVQKDIQNSSSIADQNLLIDSFSSLKGKCKVHDSVLENNVSFIYFFKVKYKFIKIN